MNITTDDLFMEIGKLTMTLRKREEQAAALDAELAEVKKEVEKLGALAESNLKKKGSETSPTT